MNVYMHVRRHEFQFIVGLTLGGRRRWWGVDDEPSKHSLRSHGRLSEQRSQSRSFETRLNSQDCLLWPGASQMFLWASK